jgi:hypothetical protein
MSAATPTPRDAGLPPPPVPSSSSLTQNDTSLNNHISNLSNVEKQTILHLGDDIRWNHELYAELRGKFNIERSYSVGRHEFITALKEMKWGNFVGMYRPFWNTGGEMGNWDEELM